VPTRVARRRAAAAAGATARARRQLPLPQSGAALVTALLIVTFVSVIASSMLWGANLDRRRAEIMLFTDQAFEYALGAEAWAGDILRDDLEKSQIDFPGEPWATALPPLPIDGGYIEGLVEDMQGRFNVNNIVDANGVVNPPAVEQFERLLASLDLEPQLAIVVADWLDGDVEVGFPDGAEDDVYTERAPPYRAANAPLTNASELLAIAGFDRASFERLRPYVTALPPGTALNVNTTTVPVLQAVAAGLGTAEADTLLEEAHQLGLQDLSALEGSVPQDALSDLSVNSGWFRVTTRVSIGTTVFTMYSLLERDAQGTIWTRFRSFGTE
jgi:general secretion pathway protein K